MDGDPLPDKDRKKIEQFLQHEVDFYSQFGLARYAEASNYMYLKIEEKQSIT